MDLSGYINERHPGLIVYAYDGESLSYATVVDGEVLYIDFIPGNYPALTVGTKPSAQAWFDELWEGFFGLFDDDTRKDLRAAAERHGVTLKPEIAELLDDATYE